MKKATLAATILLQLFAVAACSDRPNGDTAQASTAVGESRAGAAHELAYDFARPDTVLRLGPALLEISGLGVRPDGRLAAIHDEDGILFTLDPESGAAVAQRRFSGAGDYEGVEWADGATWILRSNGSLHAVPDNGGEVAEYNTWLRARCDAEGLGLDVIGRDLLVVCKEDPGPELAGFRAVYAFDLDSLSLSEGPILLLDRRAVDAREQFKPSALAVHPTTREVYVLSSVRRAVAVLSPRGALLSVTPLPPALYAQPEGIAFAEDGTLYISNEGVAGPATLLRFSPRP